MNTDPEKESLKCICDKWTEPKVFHIEGFDVRGSECPICKESYLNRDDAYRSSEFRKIKDMIMEGRIAKSGNLYVVRLPIDMVRAFGLEPGGKVKLSARTPHEILITV